MLDAARSLSACSAAAILSDSVIRFGDSVGTPSLSSDSNAVVSPYVWEVFVATGLLFRSFSTPVLSSHCAVTPVLLCSTPAFLQGCGICTCTRCWRDGIDYSGGCACGEETYGGC